MAELQKLRYSHEAMADLLLAQPMISQGQVAAYFGYSQGWVSQVINSDAFQAYLSTRKAEIVDPVLTASVEERMKSLAMRSLDVLHEKLALEPKADTALKSLEITTRALGYGAKERSEVNVNFVVALPAKAESGAAWLKEAGRVIDAEPAPAND